MTEVKIGNIALAMKEPEMLAACLDKAMQYNDARIAIWPNERNKSGWLEFGMDIHSEKSKLFLGVVQRARLANFEFHS
jgi:hypothetical protein